jgi:hypothetical protein
MVIPNHTYLVLKMPTPNVVLSVYGDQKTSHSCETENINLSEALVLPTRWPSRDASCDNPTY